MSQTTVDWLAVHREALGVQRTIQSSAVTVALALLASCSSVTVRPFSLPAEVVALQIDPQPAIKITPQLFLVDAIDEPALSELAPYSGVIVTIQADADEARCAREAMRQLLETRPDAVLVVPGRPEMAGVSTSYFANPFAPGSLSVTEGHHRTPFVAYAMRAMRAKVPFQYSLVTGVVTDVRDLDASPNLLEGDVLVTIDGAPATPPKAWPEWTLYARLNRPGFSGGLVS
jgi:hypothetical protein